MNPLCPSPLCPSPLSASLYVPALHPDLLAIANGDKLGHVRSVIFCTEDAVADRDLSYALFNLSLTLANMRADSHGPALADAPERVHLPEGAGQHARASARLRFVRVRNPEVLERILAMPGVDKLTGFVLPKLTQYNFEAYYRKIRDTSFQLMPTLETAEVFDDEEMRALRKMLEAPGVRHHILALRIGGNDLLALLGLRRPRQGTLYRTPIGPLIARLVTTFRPWGFALTAPVFEHLDNPALLEQEVQEDMAHGLTGKTAIHPDQIAVIERHYQVGTQDMEVALKIVDQNSPAVFKMHASMCEVATLHNWAHNVIEQARIFGIHDLPTPDSHFLLHERK